MTRHHYPFCALLAVATLLLCGTRRLDAASPASAEGGSPPTVLGIDGTRFTVNDRPTFLLGFSYYAALGASKDFIRRDLEDFQKRGFNWLRVWATWGGFDHVISAVDSHGEPREPFFEKLRWLVSECDRRGMIVDITLARNKGDGSNGQLPDAESHARAVSTLCAGLLPYRNWFLDLANERDIRDFRYVSAEELTRLRRRAREIDPNWLVTASFGGHDLSEMDIREALQKIGLDFLSRHRPRHAGSPAQTKAETRACLDFMKKLGRVAPLLDQEPFRRGYTTWQPSAADFRTDLQGAIEGGAAGWCFHNGSQRGTSDERPRRSFDLRFERLWDQLDAEERQFVENAKTLLPQNPNTGR